VTRRRSIAAPDAGLGGLGWLLLAHAAYSLTWLLPDLLGGEMPRQFERVFDLFDLFSRTGYSPWWDVGIAMFEAWAGYALIRMTRHHRIIATVYAVIVSTLTLWLLWPLLDGLAHLISLTPFALSLVLPAATLVLVNRDDHNNHNNRDHHNNRNNPPTARARFKQ